MAVTKTIARHGLLGLPILLLGACDSSGNVSPDKVPEGEWKAKIDALEPAQRDALFLRAIRDADQPCQDVIGSAYNGEQFGMPAWAARCRDGSDWLIMVGRDGTAQVARRQADAAPSADHQRSRQR